jgi:uncharacterized SAM-binding protein YcdF (DUF218 family)
MTAGKCGPHSFFEQKESCLLFLKNYGTITKALVGFLLVCSIWTEWNMSFV